MTENPDAGAGAANEIAPGLRHWTAGHDHVPVTVSSYYLLDELVMIIRWARTRPRANSPDSGFPSGTDP